MAKILIVEDNALNIKLFCDLLAAHGHQPEAVTDSRNALEAARSFSPDLVITDIQLPHVSGLDLIRMIRKDKKLADGADHGGDGLFRARRRGADPRRGRAGLCFEADLGGAIRADGRRAAQGSAAAAIRRERTSWIGPTRARKGPASARAAAKKTEGGRSRRRLT